MDGNIDRVFKARDGLLTKRVSTVFRLDIERKQKAIIVYFIGINSLCLIFGEKARFAIFRIK